MHGGSVASGGSRARHPRNLPKHLTAAPAAPRPVAHDRGGERGRGAGGASRTRVAIEGPGAPAAPGAPPLEDEGTVDDRGTHRGGVRGVGYVGRKGGLGGILVIRRGVTVKECFGCSCKQISTLIVLYTGASPIMGVMVNLSRTKFRIREKSLNPPPRSRVTLAQVKRLFWSSTIF